MHARIYMQLSIYITCTHSYTHQNTHTHIKTHTQTGTQIGDAKGLTEPLESFDKKPGVIISMEACLKLLERAPPFPLGEALLQAHRECGEWKLFKEKLVSNHVFHHKQVCSVCVCACVCVCVCLCVFVCLCVCACINSC